MISRDMEQPSDRPRKLSLNVLPDAQRLPDILARAEANQKSRAPLQQAEDDMTDEGPHVLIAPPDWSAAQKALHAKVVGVLKGIYDPEIPVNIYDLGLVYDLEVTEQGKVLVKMTLTAPACPVADSMPAEIEAQIQNIPECTFAHVLLVWDPPWDRERMSEAAKLQLGMM
jgi:FeS assembly SUF system protein